MPFVEPLTQSLSKAVPELVEGKHAKNVTLRKPQHPFDGTQGAVFYTLVGAIHP